MDRVIPKDVVDLIYKESHLDKIKRLNNEYHSLFRLKIHYRKEVFYYESEQSLVKVRLNYRLLESCYISIKNFKKGRITGYYVPERYYYSSGHNNLKWIE